MVMARAARVLYVLCVLCVGVGVGVLYSAAICTFMSKLGTLDARLVIDWSLQLRKWEHVLSSPLDVPG